MLRKPQHFSAFLALAMLVLIPAAGVNAQAPPAGPAGPAITPGSVVSPATLIRLFKEADEAFAAKDFNKAVAKIEELLKAIPPGMDAPLELLYFNIGLANLLGNKAADAEEAFTECLKKFPKGEYASRCYLGVGRACIMQGSPEKKQQAITSLKLAALDPRFRSEAGLSLGQVYLDLKMREEAIGVFKSLMGSDVRSPTQTFAAVEVIGLLADPKKVEDLILYLDRLINQSGVRDAIAWYANQVIVRGDELAGEKNNGSYELALAIYRSVPPRAEIIEVQKTALVSQKKDVKTLETRAAAEQDLPLNKRSNASQLLSSLKPAVELAETALKAVEEKPDLDAMIIMRRGRCLYNLERDEEALVCFRTLRTKYGTTAEAKTAAFAEIVILNKLKDMAQIKVLCDAFLSKYPNDEKTEQVATLAGEVIVQSGKWDEVGKFYQDLETKFPNSANLDRFIFFQAVSKFQDANFKESTPLFDKYLSKYPDGQFVENALYYVAMSNFFSNNYQEALKSCKEYISRYPDGHYAGDMRYRLAFIDFNDKEDQSDKIIRDLTSFLADHKEDAAGGSMYCLLADTYKKKKSDKPDELASFQQLAIEAYKNAVKTKSPDDVIQYALDQVTAMLQANKEWAAIAELHTEFIKNNPESPLTLQSVSWIVKTLARDNKIEEATKIVADALKPKIGDPSCEQVEFLIDELVKTIIPRKKAADIDIEALDKQLVEILNTAIAGQENATTNARIYYARARLSQALKRNDRADTFFKSIATINANNPAILSPALLASCGDILLKLGNLDEAQAMFQRLVDRYKDGMYADAGPVGLGYIELKRKKPAEALKIFDTAIEQSPGQSRTKEMTLGKLEAMIELGQLKESETLATETIADRAFKGEAAGKANLLLGRLYRKQSEKASVATEKLELLKKSHAIFQRVYVTYQTSPDVCAEAYWLAYEAANDLGNKVLAENTIKELKANTKLKNTEHFKKAGAIVP